MSRNSTIALFGGRDDGGERDQPTWWRGPEVLVTLFWLALVSATIAYGATQSNLTLAGAVPLSLDIAVAPTAAASNLDLSIDQPAVAVANVGVTSNNATGYQVTVRSNNVSNGFCAAPCFYSPTTTDGLVFTFYRSGTPLGFTGDSATFVQKLAPSGVGGDPYLAELAYSGGAALVGAANNYAETLVFTASLN